MMKAKHFSIILALFVFGTSFYILSQTSSTLIHSQSRSLFVSIRNYSSQVLAAKSPSSSLLSNLKFPNNYAEKYEDLLSCVTNTTPSWQSVKDYRMRDYNYSEAAANETHEVRITRAVLVYFPVDRVDEYKYEFKWLYRSWLNMMSYEPAKWRTDLVVFIYNESQLFLNRTDFFLTQLNCSFENLRRSSDDPPMCTLLSYTPLRMRNFTARHPPSKFKSSGERYRHILYETDIFSAFSSDFLEFYHLIHSSLEKYSYTDSIMMAFEGYEYAKQAGFSYLVRSDMDVFLTPLFGLWLPRHCNDFNVGRGGYSTDFNTKRFARIARNLRLDYAGVENLGSTWYSTPQQFRLVSYLTLFGMAYLAQEEFTQVERDGKLGVALWPDWHYGVLLLYGQHLALNHLIANKQINVVKLEDQLDFPSGNRRSVMLMLHIHVFHGDNLFSKFAFKMGKYDNKTVSDRTLLGQVKYYALQMALDGKRLSPQNLTNMLDAQIHSKH